MSAINNVYSRFVIERFSLPLESQLEALEQRIGVRFPEDYREFLVNYNGGYFNLPEIGPVCEGCPRDELAILFGIGASHWEAELATPATLALFDDNSPPRVVPIGETATGGLIVLVTQPGRRGTIYLKKAFGDLYHLADGIEGFFGLLGNDKTLA